MLVDIPVFIAFDCNPDSRRHPNQVAYCAGKRVITLRYDVADNDRPAQYCMGYPPTEHSMWSADKDGLLLGLLDRQTDETLTKRAAGDPETYAAEVAAS